MAVYYKFKSAKDYDSIPILGQSISVVSLKDKIFHSKQLGYGRDFDLVVSNAQTNEEYLDESAMIPTNSSVLIRRIAGWPYKPILVEQDKPKVDDEVEDLTPPIISMMDGSPSTMGYTEESVWDDFGDDPYAIPEVAVTAQLSNSLVDTSPACRADEEMKIKALVENSALEDMKIKALVENSALDWNRQIAYGAGRGFGMRRRMMADRSFGLERQTPPAGYICHRCKVPGHFIQHCPTNGDPSYDIQRMKPSIGIQNSMLLASATSSCAPSSGIVTILKPNEAAFEKEIKGLPSTCPVSDIPPELRCPLCKELMKDAVLTRKCCFRSYCDKCIRDYTMTKSKCMCGVMNVLADDLVPNIALREIINHTLKSTPSSTENLGSLTEVRDVDYVHNLKHKVPASKDAKQLLSKGMEALDTSEGKVENVDAHSTKNKVIRKADPSETIPKSIGAKEAISVENLQVPEMDQKKLIGGEQGFVENKKKNKKMPLLGTVADMSWRAYQNFGAENFYGIPTFNQYWAGGVPMGGDGYLAPFNDAMPYMCLTTGPFDVPSGRILPQEQFPAQGHMMPSLPQRNLSEEEMNNGVPIMSREEFVIKKAILRRMRKSEKLCRMMESSTDQVREVSSGGTNDSPVEAKPSLMSQFAPVDLAYKEERFRNAEKLKPDLRRHSSSRPTKHRESASEKRKLDSSRHSSPIPAKLRASSLEKCKLNSSRRPVRERASSPEKHKLDSGRHSSPKPVRQRASSPEKHKLDSSRHSSPRPVRERESGPEKHNPVRQRASSPVKHKLDSSRQSSPRPVRERASSPEKHKLDSSRHSLLRPAKKASSQEKRKSDWSRHSSPRSAKQGAPSHDRNQKNSDFSHISLDESGSKKRKVMNESKDNKVERRTVGNGYCDERKTEKRSEGGVAGQWWGGRYDDESSEEECHFKRRRRSPRR